MYVREEKIEEENLDWGALTKVSNDNQDKLIEDLKEETAQPPASKKKKMFLNHSAKIDKIGQKFTIKSKLTDLFKQNSEIALLLGMLFIPYILGFVISYFLFYFYGGMPISNFLSVQHEFELWSIGAYLFVTAWLIWAILSPNNR